MDRRRSPAWLPALVVATACVWPSAAHADASPSAGTDGGVLRGSVDYNGDHNGSGAATRTIATARRARPAFTYEAKPISVAAPAYYIPCAVGRPWPPSGPPPPADGVLYDVTVRDATGRVVRGDDKVCFPPVDPHAPGASSHAPAPLTPPTVGEIWDRAALPAPAVGLDPASRGVTGLDTRLWTDTPGDVTIAAARDGYSFAGTAHVVGYRFHTDDGPDVAAATAGAPGAPAVHHTFERKGARHLAVSSIWRASVTFTGPDFPTPLTITLPDAAVTTTRAYPVIEVRSVLLQ